MIEKWYEVSCDLCGQVVNHYIGNKPTKEELNEDGAVLYKTFIFCCEDCYNKFKQKEDERRYKIRKEKGIRFQ